MYAFRDWLFYTNAAMEFCEKYRVENFDNMCYNETVSMDSNVIEVLVCVFISKPPYL